MVSHLLSTQDRETLAESFYNVKYGSSIIMSKVSLSNENINTGVSVVFKTKRELKCPNRLHIFLEKTVFMFSLLRIFDKIFDVIIDDPYLTL